MWPLVCPGVGTTSSWRPPSSIVLGVEPGVGQLPGLVVERLGGGVVGHVGGQRRSAGSLELLDRPHRYVRPDRHDLAEPRLLGPAEVHAGAEEPAQLDRERVVVAMDVRDVDVVDVGGGVADRGERVGQLAERRRHPPAAVDQREPAGRLDRVDVDRAQAVVGHRQGYAVHAGRDLEAAGIGPGRGRDTRGGGHSCATMTFSSPMTAIRRPRMSPTSATASSHSWLAVRPPWPPWSRS